MYSFTGQSQYGSYNSTYASSPAIYNTAAQSQPTSHNPTIGGVGGVGVSNPNSVYASFSSAVAPTPSPYPPPAYANPGAAAAAAAAAATYAQYSQTAAAVASMQQQQHQHQQHQLQNVAGGVVSASAGYPTQNATRLTDSYGTIASVTSAGGAYTPLSDYTNPLRTGAAGIALPTNSVSNNTYVGMTRIGNSPGGQMMNAVSSSGSASNYNSYDAAVYAAASSYLQSKAAGAANVWMSAGTKSSDGYNNFTSVSSNSSNIPITGRGFLGTRGRGTFPSKRIGHTRNSDAQLFYCETCKISCAGAQTYKEHIDGQKHKKKEALQKGEGQTLSKSRVSFRCETCNVTCTGKDTYDSHIRGSKHQKTANLMKKMGKPVTDAPTVLAPGEKSNKQSAPANGTPIATVGGPAVPTKKVIAASSIKFISGEPLQSATLSSARKAPEIVEPIIPTSIVNNAEVEAALAKEKEVQPVGEDYVEEERNAAGKLVQFNCKLCDCKFSDPNAKNIHIKGRKHRLQYKLKVNPSLVVEMKPNQVPREMRNELARKLRSQRVQASAPRSHGPPQPLIMPESRNWFGMAESSRCVETNEDRHVMAKHNMIYPEEEQLFAIEKMVTLTEKALKTVSDKLAEDDTKMANDEKKESFENKERVLKGVMRVGLLAKGLLLKTDEEVELVVLCSQPPTRNLLSKVGELLPDSAKKGENEVITIVENPKESSLLLKYSCSETLCRIVFTCAALRDGIQNEILTGDGATAAASTKATPPRDPLPKVPCLEALAEQRHAKWFQARCSNLQSATVTLRILRDVRQRIPSWEPLKAWATELLVAKVLISAGAPLSPGDAIRRVFEAIASGILFKDGPGLLDPCEKHPYDVLSDLTGQQREDITASSQHALRLIAFNQLYKVLGIDRLTEQRGERKRLRDSNGNHSDSEALDVKKDKKDDAKAGDKKIA